jgi:ATP-binding cassette subfamily B protein/subfamily B ATP-binding cassette protein MsbA
MVGLIGPSGAGKTTIVDLVLRLFELNKGEILIDGINISQIDIAQWRKNIGYVSQDIFLINDTIANNIKFYDESIIEKDIEEAARMANIYDFIQGCPEKFSTIIGERGVLLSAGQRQRIIIARILARQPKILILDEATSALDNESEKQIQRVIENLKNRITVFAIAHRLSTLINSDRLLVLENGKIIESGRPRELLGNKSSYFYKVYYIKK